MVTRFARPLQWGKWLGMLLNSLFPFWACLGRRQIGVCRKSNKNSSLTGDIRRIIQKFNGETGQQCRNRLSCVGELLIA